MADLGRLAGVSASTVSRALQGSPAIPQATRDRIHQIAKEHHYVLDVRAQNFRLQRSMTIATVFPYLGQSKRLISDPFYMEIMGAISNALENYGYDMLVARVHAAEDEWCLRYVMNKRVDGLILIDRSIQDKGIEKLQELDANFVVWGGKLDKQDYVTVGCDGVEGAVMAVKHLAALGRRRIGFIGGDQNMVETFLRRQGYEQGLLESGLALDDRLITYTDFSPQAGAKAITKLLNQAPDLDGVFVCSDFMSIAAMEVLRKRGRRVPEDISVVGYDDIQLAAHCSPRLTTIQQQISEGGRQMVEKLFEQIEGMPCKSSILPIELIVRDSCGG
jgi:DNA-binding LacI/PurR family transcriptional regulator